MKNPTDLAGSAGELGRNIIIIPPKGLLPKYKFSVRGRNPFCMDSDFHIYIDIFRILVVNSLDNSDTFFLREKDSLIGCPSY